jgi:DNA-binding LacI/PurR family transcriptional regulator
MSALDAVLFIVAAASVILLVSAQVLRGARRLSFMLLGVIGLAPSVIGIIVSTVGGGAATSSVLTVVGVVASFAFGLAGERFNITQGRDVRLGLVIASKDAFHQEVRQGLSEELRGTRVRVTDLGGSPAAPREDLTYFSECLRRTVDARVDYLVIWAPGGESAQGEEVLEAVRALRRRGGLTIFLENGPQPSTAYAGYATVRHDAVGGSALLREVILNVSSRHPGPVLIVLGPQFSPPALRRAEALSAGLGEMQEVEYLQLVSWSIKDAIELVAERVKSGCRPAVVVCPNDAIALALVDDIPDWRQLSPLKKARIIGFDGMRRAVACIAERGTNFEGTIAISPSEYGRIAGHIVRTIGRPSTRPGRATRRAAKEYLITFDSRKIMDPPRARRRLYDEYE